MPADSRTVKKISIRRPNHRDVKRALAEIAAPERAANSAWFFKTGKGQYGEGDRFIGVSVPQQRKIAIRFRDLSLDDIARLLASPIHEHRFTALEILVAQYERADADGRETIVNFYLDHTARVNNWDLVDTSASYILGDYLRSRPRDILEQLAASKNIWERRIAIVAAFAFLKDGEIEDTLRIAEKLLSDKHDLIQKAVGWALREAGKTSRPALVNFLRGHYETIPRTALRYAIEHFSPAQRKGILAGVFDKRVSK